jgi:hypothetical protein
MVSMKAVLQNIRLVKPRSYSGWLQSLIIPSDADSFRNEKGVGCILSM